MSQQTVMACAEIVAGTDAQLVARRFAPTDGDPGDWRFDCGAHQVEPLRSSVDAGVLIERDPVLRTLLDGPYWTALARVSGAWTAWIPQRGDWVPAADFEVKVLLPVPADRPLLARSEQMFADADAETVWSRPLGDGRYELENVPFLAMGANAGDVVSGHPAVNQPVIHFDSVVEPRGWRTVRIMILEGGEQVARQTLDELAARGHAVEHGSGAIWAVGIAPRANPEHAERLLQDGVASGFLRIEGPLNSSSHVRRPF
jgi:hypothetical protein